MKIPDSRKIEGRGGRARKELDIKRHETGQVLGVNNRLKLVSIITESQTDMKRTDSIDFIAIKDDIEVEESFLTNDLTTGRPVCCSAHN